MGEYWMDTAFSSMFSMLFPVPEFRKLYYPKNALLAVETFHQSWVEIMPGVPIYIMYIGGLGMFEVSSHSYTVCLEAKRIMMLASVKTLELQQEKGGFINE